VVAHTYNTTYLEGKAQKDCYLRAVRAKFGETLISTNKLAMVAIPVSPTYEEA
jgi:hypothetical protein